MFPVWPDHAAAILQEAASIVTAEVESLCQIADDAERWDVITGRWDVWHG